MGTSIFAVPLLSGDAAGCCPPLPADVSFSDVAKLKQADPAREETGNENGNPRRLSSKKLHTHSSKLRKFMMSWGLTLFQYVFRVSARTKQKGIKLKIGSELYFMVAWPLMHYNRTGDMDDAKTA